MDRTCTSCHGHAPNDHDVKLNVDGGLARDGSRRAAAVICRDKNGKYIGVSAIVFEGLVDPATLEAQACKEALALATDLHLDSLCTASDCLEMVANIASVAQDYNLAKAASTLIFARDYLYSYEPLQINKG